jgi:hypothetical protein
MPKETPSHSGSRFEGTFLAQHNFSDAEGWNQLVYYGSLRFADVNGDGKSDICGRRALGSFCALAKIADLPGAPPIKQVATSRFADRIQPQTS